MTIPTPPLHAEVTRSGSMVLITVHGHARILDQQIVDEWLSEATASGSGHILVDVSDLDDMWAVTVSVLVVGFCRRHRCGNRVGVIVAQPEMAETLCRHGLCEVVTIYLSADDAVLEDALTTGHAGDDPLDGLRIGVADEGDRRTANVRIRKPARHRPRSAVPQLDPDRQRS